MADYPRALQALSRAPIARFVAERTRLAAELRAAGDEVGAKRLGQRRRPTASAWAVNQLYWDARKAFDALLAAAAKLRAGDLSETRAYRDALAALRTRAAAVLRDAGHGATEATLRRVTGTLAAVAAAGGFDPEPPGTLTSDREPPGFEAVGASAAPVRASRTAAPRCSGLPPPGRRRSERGRASEARAKLKEEARAKKQAELKAEQRRRLEAALRAAHARVQTHERALARLREGAGGHAGGRGGRAHGGAGSRTRAEGSGRRRLSSGEFHLAHVRRHPERRGGGLPDVVDAHARGDLAQHESVRARRRSRRGRSRPSARSAPR